MAWARLRRDIQLHANMHQQKKKTNTKVLPVLTTIRQTCLKSSKTNDAYFFYLRKLWWQESFLFSNFDKLIFDKLQLYIKINTELSCSYESVCTDIIILWPEQVFDNVHIYLNDYHCHFLTFNWICFVYTNVQINLCHHYCKFPTIN